MNNLKSTKTLSKSDSWRMFDDISPRYDFLNHLISFGMHLSFRDKMAEYLPLKQSLKLLDLATGTAEVLIRLFKKSPSVQSACGIDLSDKMMDIGRKKIASLGWQERITLHHGDAHQIPFNDRAFDAVTIAFGIRNMENPRHVLTEMLRVLDNGGRALILEFSLPRNSVVRNIYLFYLRYLVPLMGVLLTGHYYAYRYLNQTVETFPSGEAFCALMTDAGFKNIAAHPLLFGAACIYTGDKI